MTSFSNIFLKTIDYCKLFMINLKYIIYNFKGGCKLKVIEISVFIIYE